ncbi:ATP-dependent DNA helicase pif1 [Paramuricea clavata]|uniref:ATP-dependent DNA helicase n=1 Tax=Paramuricea clavata TaxID=317549 RepID=A0A7D9D9D4_PARCT|nr:ATP-dependent DNA helicase pif1 [Paramuricea clavata]
MPTWIKTNKEEYTIDEQYDVVDINSFSEMKKLAYDIVKSHFDDTSSDKETLCLIINGVPGTDKSYLINAIRNILQSKYALAATTGKAAYNIRGVTVHSLLKLPIGSRGKKDLTGQSFCRLQESVNINIGYIIIDHDEYSMLGQVTFRWIDKRSKQVTGYNDKVFGGKVLILTGDPRQLPPVADKSLYHAKPSNAVVPKLTLNQCVQGMTSEQQKNNHRPPDLSIAFIQSLSHHRQKEVSMRGNSYLSGRLGSDNTQEARTYTSKSMDRYWQI